MKFAGHALARRFLCFFVCVGSFCAFVIPVVFFVSGTHLSGGRCLGAAQVTLRRPVIVVIHMQILKRGLSQLGIDVWSLSVHVGIFV